MNAPSNIIKHPLSISEAPMGHAKAMDQAKVLLGSYPREPHDPPIFIRGIVQVLAEYPYEVGREAIKRLTRRLKYLPTPADLVEDLEQEMKPIRDQKAKHTATVQEFRKRAELAASSARIRGERQELRCTLGEAWDAWWSIPAVRRLAGGTPAQFARGWNVAPDKGAFIADWGAEECPLHCSR